MVVHKYIKFCIKLLNANKNYAKFKQNHFDVDNKFKVNYNFGMFANLLSISELAVKVIAGLSGVLLAIVIVIILIFRKKDDKD